ncbi:MAG: hypothetical protein KGI79_03455 [Patescibacteria group bacterium]|nr:hypothetical protein [Patescibacteria group bacterium]MDE2116904.1 hypothetical protein [Patescibacteria group bacterium]
MPDVEFFEEKSSPVNPVASTPTGLTGFVIKYAGRFIQTPAQAAVFLVASSVVLIVITTVILIRIASPRTPALSPAESGFFQGKTPAERHLVPQSIDQSVFSKQP